MIGMQDITEGRLSFVARMARLLMLLGFIALVCGGCGEDPNREVRKQLLIYCGITMARPMAEIKAIIEREENCEILMTTGGSGNLLKALKENKSGDLYLPGSEKYIQICRDEGLVTESVHVGYNRAALLVQKGNPKNISPDLSNLTSKDYYVVMCNPETGSIGRETADILQRAGLFEEARQNAREFTTDSKRLIQLLRDKQADLAINWYATATWEENRPYVDALQIDPQYARPKKLVLGLLTTSRYPEIAKKFMNYAISEQGKAIFRKYGLHDAK
jgi:molybdate transport system substrate-binding protein